MNFDKFSYLFEKKNQPKSPQNLLKSLFNILRGNNVYLFILFYHFIIFQYLTKGMKLPFFRWGTCFGASSSIEI